MVTKSKESIKERFLRDIATHQMEVRLDAGLYRHVVFKRPNTNCMLFSLTTTPGRLTYAGDMGCFVFERLPDMFSFFRSDPHEREPNFGYWHEKLVAVCRHGSEEKNVDRFRDNLEQYIENDDSLTEDQVSEIREFIEEAVSEYEESGPQCAYRSVADWSLSSGDKHRNRRQFFADFWQYSDSVYTLHYEWACHAIQWGIAQYDEWKSKQIESPPPFAVPFTSARSGMGVPKS